MINTKSLYSRGPFTCHENPEPQVVKDYVPLVEPHLTRIVELSENFNLNSLNDTNFYRNFWSAGLIKATEIYQESISIYLYQWFQKYLID